MDEVLARKHYKMAGSFKGKGNDHMINQSVVEEGEEDTKIYGIYPGYLENPEFFQQCSEQDLYFAVLMLGGDVWSSEYMTSRKEKGPTLIEQRYAYEYCVSQTRRFGVEVPVPQANHHILNTLSYWTWFAWWNQYFQHQLSEEQLHLYETKRARGEDVSMFRPTGNWEDKISKDPVKTV